IDAWKKVPGVKVPDTKPGTEFEFAGSQWRILDTDMNDNSSDGLQALVIKVESIGDSQFISDSNRTTYFSSAGTNGYEDSAAGGLKQTINAWYTTTIASNPALEAMVQKVSLNNPDFTTFSAIGLNSNNGPTSWHWKAFYNELRFATTLDASGRQEAFALSYGDIYGHMAQMPDTGMAVPLLDFPGSASNKFWLRSPGHSEDHATSTDTSDIAGLSSVSDISSVRPALSLLIK
ncbi:hypothetical protein, partial [Pseudolactococcus yaeyamensis]